MRIKKVTKNRKFRIVLGIICLLFLIVIVTADKRVSNQTKEFIFDNVQQVPDNKAGLVLGTSKKLENGDDNLYFVYRIQAAKQLYDAGKVRVFVVSGDNSTKEANETEDMKKDLIASGIPSDNIYLDYAGFRTLDSVIRMKEIFGQEKFTIISQKFHNERAIFIAKHYGWDVVGFNAQDVTSYYGFRTMVREKLARVKVFIDFLTNKQPRYLGEKIKIN